MKSISPTKLVIRTRQFFTKKLTNRYYQSKALLKQNIISIQYVCTTADCWTTRRRSFLGVTVHWLTNELVRKSYCLAVRRIRGSHTYDVLAKLLEEIHEEFNLNHKLTATITDSGSNFIKAFRVFGVTNDKEVESQHNNENELSDSESDSQSNCDIAAEESENVNQNVNKDMNFFPITEILNSSNAALHSPTYSLPPHRKCACHMLNLVATADLQKISDRCFLKIFNSTTAKLKAIWRKQSASSNATDFIESKLGKLFVVPNATRWNSFYMALVRVKYFATHNSPDLREVFLHFGLQPLRPVEEETVREYVSCLKPISDALDILQGEKNITLGYLLPTISVLKSKVGKHKKLWVNSSLQALTYEHHQ